MKADTPSIDATREQLHRFAASGCDVSFRALFDSHAGLVYHAALRTGRGDRQLAEDVVQTVFTSLARKASTFSPRIILPAWLHRHACLTTRQMMRSTRRRQAREEASAVLHGASGSPADQIAGLIDEALDSLSRPDRAALALRFFENKDLRTVGRELGVSEDAAQKRVSRGLERLRAMLERRGVKTVSSSVAGALLSGPANALPSGLGSLAAVSLHAASATTCTFPPLLGLISFLTMKTSTLVTASILVIVAGTALITLTARSESKILGIREDRLSTGSESVVGEDVVQAPHRLEIPVIKGVGLPLPQAPPKPVAKLDDPVREAFERHPMKKIVEERVNVIWSGSLDLLKKAAVDLKEKQAFYRQLQAVAMKPGTTGSERAAVQAQMDTLSAEIERMEQEQTDHKKSISELCNRNMTDSMQAIIADIKNPSPPPRRPTLAETSSFNSGENLFLKGDYAAAENAFTPLVSNPDSKIAAAAQWKVLLTRMIQGKDNSNEIQPLLSTTTSAACYAMAANAVQQGGWEEANFWVGKARERGAPEENALFNDPLVEMGWMDPATGFLIPPTR